MGKTKIEWVNGDDGSLGATWNPIRGCQAVSPGCKNCFAARMAARGLPGLNSPTTGEPFAVMRDSGPRWTGKVELIESALGLPLRWRKPRRVFVNSMSDLFHESLPDEAIDRVFAVMALCPQHTFMVLTKRPERAVNYFRDATDLRSRWFDVLHDVRVFPGDPRRAALGNPSRAGIAEGIYKGWRSLQLPNVWLGVSVEDRKNKERIELLRNTPAALRFLSLEPLLEDLGELDLTGISWCIIGGESGPGARRCDVDWIRKIVWQCQAASIPVFVKQLGAHVIENGERRIKRDKKGGDMDEWAHDIRVREWPEVPHAK